MGCPSWKHFCAQAMLIAILADLQVASKVDDFAYDGFDVRIRVRLAVDGAPTVVALQGCAGFSPSLPIVDLKSDSFRVGEPSTRISCFVPVREQRQRLIQGLPPHREYGRHQCTSK
jgi:hypothetical protein